MTFWTIMCTAVPVTGLTKAQKPSNKINKRNQTKDYEVVDQGFSLQSKN